MDMVSGLLGGFQSVLQPSNFFYCFVGVFVGTLIGVLPGIGPIGAMSILLPSTFGIPPATPDHACRHLLRRDVRRFDDLDSGQHSRRGRVRHHLPRRVPDGAQGKGRPGARHFRLRFLYRRHLQYYRAHVPCLSSRGCSAQVRSPGVLLRHLPFHDRSHLSGVALGAACGADGSARIDPRVRRHGPDFRHPALRLRLRVPPRRYRPRSGRHGSFRHLGGPPQYRSTAGEGHL